MKHILLLLLFAATLGVQAQSPFRFGLKGGATVSSFSHGQPHMGDKLGFTVGAFGAYHFSDLIGLQVEAAYFQQGGSLVRFTDETRFGAEADFFTKNVTTSRITLHNIEVPVLLRVAIPMASEIQPLVFAGPSIGFNVGATENYERTGELSNGVYVTATGHHTVTSQYELYQAGATAGLGLELPLGSKKLLVDARYRYGITPVKKSYSYIDMNGVASKVYTNSLAFTVGIGF